MKQSFRSGCVTSFTGAFFVVFGVAEMGSFDGSGASMFRLSLLIVGLLLLGAQALGPTKS
jgi:hypothetical protein